MQKMNLAWLKALIDNKLYSNATTLQNLRLGLLKQKKYLFYGTF